MTCPRAHCRLDGQAGSHCKGRSGFLASNRPGSHLVRQTDNRLNGRLLGSASSHLGSGTENRLGGRAALGYGSSHVRGKQNSLFRG